ncbi:MAG: hypothetical protein M3P14_10470 [Chloroflexota bacterium]|nr:hypothetical protein [Chloroflexota bacterium]
MLLDAAADAAVDAPVDEPELLLLQAAVTIAVVTRATRSPARFFTDVSPWGRV